MIHSEKGVSRKIDDLNEQTIHFLNNGGMNSSMAETPVKQENNQGKRTDEPFFPFGSNKGNKKKRRNAKKKEKKSKLPIDFELLAKFNTVGIHPPTYIADLPNTIAQLEQRIQYYADLSDHNNSHSPDNTPEYSQVFIFFIIILIRMIRKKRRNKKKNFCSLRRMKRNFHRYLK